MYYKLKLNKEGTKLNVIDYVDYKPKKPDGFIYATQDELNRIEKSVLESYENILDEELGL